MNGTLCAVCFSLLGWQALAGEVDDTLKKFEAALQKSVTEQPKTPEAAAKPGEPNINAIMVPRLRECIAANNLKGAIEILQQLNTSMLQNMDTAQISEEAKKTTSDLLSALLKEQEARQKAAAAAMDALLQHATEAVKNAKAPTDLDAILAELTKLKDQQPGEGGFPRRFGDEETQNYRSKVEEIARFVSRWQDYLTAKAAQNKNQIRQDVRELSGMEVLLLPRSEILAKADEPLSVDGEVENANRHAQEAADALVAKTKSLDGIDDLIMELRKLGDAQKTGNVGSGSLHPYIKGLEEIDRSYHEYQNGLPTNNNVFQENRQGPAALLPLKNQLLLLVLPSHINAPAEVKPKPGEGVTDFLKRVVEEAKESGSMDLAIRARQVLRKLKASGTHSKTEENVLRNVQAAQNLEAAGQYMMAVVSYQTTLKIGSDIVPVKWIGKRLEEIKKDHPEDYQKGIERSLQIPQPSASGATAKPKSKPESKSEEE